MKKYWKEILIAILIGLLLWISPSERVRTIGSSDTLCITDTILTKVPANIVRYERVKVFVIDTIYQHDTDTTIIVRRDTSWLYADVPLIEYVDGTNYYVRTIGWLDSIAVYPHYEQPKIEDKKKRDKMTLFINSQVGYNILAPGASMSIDRYQVGANYNAANGGLILTVGYRLY